jgi:hypothetical protein
MECCRSQEFRLQLDLHGWLIGINMFQTTNWSVPLGRSIIATDEVMGVDWLMHGNPVRDESTL